MPHFDPLYGELLSSKETSLLTGFTLNQLRNSRLPSRIENAPFGYVMIGSAPYYRKAVIQLWLDQNGGRQSGVYKPAGLDALVPLAEQSEADHRKYDALSQIADITTETAYNRWFGRLMTQDRELTNKATKERQKYYIAKHYGKDPSEVEWIPPAKRFEQPDWFIGTVPALREVYSQLSGFDLTEQDLLSLPIGQVPPFKEQTK